MKNLILFTICLSILFISCKKEERVNFELTKNYGTADFILSDSKDIVDNIISENQSARTASICEEVIITFENEDHFETPDTITIDFGNGECNYTKTIVVNGISYQVNF